MKDGFMKDITLDIESLRKEIDDIDRTLENMLKRRFQITDQIATIKKAKGIATFDPKREVEMRNQRRMRLLEEPHQEALMAIFEEIIRCSRQEQDKLRF